MAFAPSTVLERRREQMFPQLTPVHVDIARRFGGPPRKFGPGEILFHLGDVGAPAWLVLNGYIEVARRDALGHREVITRHSTGMMAGEVSQLAGGPSFVEGCASPEGCEVVPFDASHLRSLIVGNAEVGEILMRAFILRRVALIETGSGTVIIGRRDSADALRLRNFLTRNGVPHTVVDPETDTEAAGLIERLAIERRELPIVACPDGTVLRNPVEKQLARCLGLLPNFEGNNEFDVAVVGAGPAGLATAVYAASEGLSVIVLDSRSFGGQAGASSRIENYLGFPTGISGQALAGRAFNQAQKFGAVMAIPAEVRTLECGVACDKLKPQDPSVAVEPPAPRRFRVRLDDDSVVRASSVVIASGARYRRLGLDNLAQFEGDGVYYWASPIEAKLCATHDVIVVGGGNSAGQAAVYLAGHAARVHILVRGPSLAATMSRYLIDRIEALPNVTLHPQTEIVRLHGSPEAGLSSVVWKQRQTGVEIEHAIRYVFLFIGADPNTEWLRGCPIAVDANGFVCTGSGAAEAAGGAITVEPGSLRAPLPNETTQSGVFAVGDVRAGSVKRVASAVGEGSVVVSQLHGYLAESRRV
jgi:thioredoxin reductase (NADPH)